MINIKTFEIVRTKDLKSFYVLAKDEADAINRHFQNLNGIEEDKGAKLFETEKSFILVHNDDVFCLVKESGDKNLPE